MPLKLDKKDKKLLTMLDENARYSNTQIAKKIGLSKPAVEYRIQRLHQNRVIFEYYTVINFTLLGYFQYKIYFKFQDTTLEDESKMVAYWKQASNSVWVAQVRGRWDLAVSILARSNFEFGKILNAFMNRFAKFVLLKDVLLTEYSPIYAREYLIQTKPSAFLYGIPAERYELDTIERTLLRAISTHARLSIVELVKKTGLSRDVIQYRLKKLKKERVIVHYRCYPNLEVLGIKFYKVIFRLKNFDSATEKRLNTYVAQHKHSPQLLKLIGSWDLEVEFETETEDDLYKYLAEVRKEFSSIIRDFDIIRITKTYKYDYFPF